MKLTERVNKKIIINVRCPLDVFILLFKKLWVFLGLRKDQVPGVFHLGPWYTHPKHHYMWYALGSHV